MKIKIPKKIKIDKYMDIYRLIQKQEKKKSYKEELFKKILTQVHRRIEFSSNSGDNFSIFTIPMYVMGYPLFNRNECATYLINELRENGFEVQSYSDQYLYISWNHIYQKYLQEKEIAGENVVENPREIIERNIESKVKRSNELIFNNNSFSLLK